MFNSIFSYYSKLDEGFGVFLFFNFTMYLLFTLIISYLMVTVWFNEALSVSEAALVCFAYFLQIFWFLLFPIALTLTIEEAYNKLRDVGDTLKITLGKEDGPFNCPLFPKSIKL